MCGIIGYIGKNKKAIPILIDGLKNLEYREYDSAGIAYFNNNVEIIKSKGKIKDLEEKIDIEIESEIGLGHTRWATHGEANLINSHPHKVGSITIVHNGIIKNYNGLKKQLAGQYNFDTETDTEIADKTINNLKEVAARGAKIVVIVSEDLSYKVNFADKKIVIPKIDDILQPILSIIPLQIYSYQIAKLRGCDIDKPKNLAKSVTVE